MHFAHILLQIEEIAQIRAGIASRFCDARSDRTNIFTAARLNQPETRQNSRAVPVRAVLRIKPLPTPASSNDALCGAPNHRKQPSEEPPDVSARKG